MIPISRNDENALNTRIVPVVFVPGVMGSRLEFINSGNFFYKENRVWDPDDTGKMSRWIVTNASSQGYAMKSQQEVRIMTELPKWMQESKDARRKLTEEEIARGWSTVAIGVYSPFLRYLAKEKFGAAQVPVYAVGYDWRKSNKESGAFLTQKIREIIAAVNEKLQTEAVKKVVVVTHSMGGLVARAALKDAPDLADQVLGVMHVVQPVEGAAVAYRRFFTGMVDDLDGGWGFSKVLGNTGAKFSKIASGLPGPIELLPTDKYRDTRGKNWLGYLEKGVLKHWANDNVYNLYNGGESPPALVYPDQSNPNPPTDRSDSMWIGQAAADDLTANVENARNFHEWLDIYKHPQTWAIYGDALETDTAIHFEPTKPPPPHIEETKFPNGNFITEEGVEWVHRGAKPKRFKEGDGTVPAASGRGLFPKEIAPPLPAAPRINAKVRQFKVKDLEHGAAFDKDIVQQAVSAAVRYLLSQTS